VHELSVRVDLCDWQIPAENPLEMRAKQGQNAEPKFATAAALSAMDFGFRGIPLVTLATRPLLFVTETGQSVTLINAM
jgi:hypothetical protein